MYTEIWNKVLPATCKIDLIGELGYTLKSYTGFKIKEVIVTSNQVFNNDMAKTVEISFFDQTGYNPKIKLRINYTDFVNELQAGPKDNKWEFGIILASFISEYNIESIKTSFDDKISIGSEIAIIGSGSHNNLIITKGIVTGKFNDNGIIKIQSDIKVNSGFEGAPVFDINNGTIIGTITSQTNDAEIAFKQIQNISNNNILRLKGITDSLIVDDIDIIQVLQAGQQQIKHFSSVLLKHTNLNETKIMEIKGLATFIETVDASELSKKTYQSKNINITNIAL